MPGWDRYSWLRAGFSTRLGGHSNAYGRDEQNLGWTAEDDAAVVASNRAAFAAALGQGTTPSLTTVQQVHSATVLHLDQQVSPLMTDSGKARLEGDGMISCSLGRLLAILTADCVPVLIADTRTHAVAALHAGWRGTLGRIVERGVAAMQANCGSHPDDLIAAIGPCIHACCFKVGEEVRSAFAQQFPYAGQLFASGADGSLSMDLVLANRTQLLSAGLHPDHISVVAECTACRRLATGARKYFSYRAENGKTGRMLSGIAAVA